MLLRLSIRSLCLSILILLAILSPLPSGSIGHRGTTARAVSTQSPSSSSSNLPAIVAVEPANITGASLAVGQRVTFSVDVINSSAITFFEVRLTYNYRVLGHPTLDYSSNVFGSNAVQFYNCVDDHGACTTEDDLGVITLGLVIFGDVGVTPPPIGILFKMSFTIIAVGFSQFHLTPEWDPFGTILFLGRTTIPLVTRDGFFSNAFCPSNSTHLCTPPQTDFTFLPAIGLAGRQIQFNVTLSKATNPGAIIQNYTWNWGFCFCAPTQLSSNVTTVTHVFQQNSNYTVTLVTFDSDGISWQLTKIVQVIVDFAMSAKYPTLAITNQPNIVSQDIITIAALSTLNSQGFGIVSAVPSGWYPGTSMLPIEPTFVPALGKSVCLLDTYGPNGKQIPFSTLRLVGPIAWVGDTPPCGRNDGFAFLTGVPSSFIDENGVQGIQIQALNTTAPGSYTIKLIATYGFIVHTISITVVVLKPAVVHQLVYSHEVSLSAGGIQSFKLGVTNPDVNTVYAQVTVTSIGSLGHTFTIMTPVFKIGPYSNTNNIQLSIVLTATDNSETFTFSTSIVEGLSASVLTGTSTQQSVSAVFHVVS